MVGTLIHAVATYNFIISTARVVCPGGLLHHIPCDCLEVHQVVACLQRGHPLDPLLPLGFFGVCNLLFLFDGAHVNLSKVLRGIEVFFQSVRRVNRVEFLGRILACVLQDDLLATGMLCCHR